MSTQVISQHLQYKIPQFKLALIREPEPRATSIHTPDDIEQFVEPMKHFRGIFCCLPFGRKAPCNRVSRSKPWNNFGKSCPSARSVQSRIAFKCAHDHRCPQPSNR
jgi:hypothetical protein